MALSFAPAHGPGLSDAAFIELDGAVRLVTCGQDARLCLRQDSGVGEVLKEVAHAAGGSPTPLHCVAASPGAPHAAVGDERCFVQVYGLPGGELEATATRFALPVRALAYSPSGATLAAGGDDESIKLINVEDRTVFRSLPAPAYTRSLAYDPEGAYLASVDADGSLAVWDVTSGKAQVTKKRACPKVGRASVARSQAAWHPDGGSLLAAPGTDADIHFYERLSWDLAFTLKAADQHKADVSLVAFSKNGLYLATAALDQSLVVWDLTERRPLARRLLAGTACGLAWHPGRNALAVVTDDGELAFWEEVVPAGMPGPTADVDAVMGLKKAGATDGAGASVLDERADGASPSSADSEEGDSLISHTDLRRRRGRRGGARLFGLGDGAPDPQDPIQPGATQLGESGRRYLAYTLEGYISQKVESDSANATGNVVEVAFHDTSRMRRRVPLLTDFYGLTMGALCDKGAFYASPPAGNVPSTLVYRAFEPWAPNTEWAAPLPAGEEAACVAVAPGFAAAATSARLLRLYTAAGRQSHVLALAGAPVALAASGHLLAAAFHGGPPAADGDQRLEYQLYDVGEQRLLGCGPLPLSPGATLAWLGFSAEGVLGSYDSEGELRLRAADMGGAWVPAFSSRTERKGSESYWVVGLSSSELHCVVCPQGGEPAVAAPGAARPIVIARPLRVPVAAADAALATLESEAIRAGLLAGHLQLGVAEARAEEADLAAAQTEADKITLRLFQKLAADRPARAMEAVATLHSAAAIEGALRLAAHARQGALAERIASFLERRLALEAEADAEAAVPEAQLAYDARAQGADVTPVHPPACGGEGEEEGHGARASPAPAATAHASRVSPLGRPLAPAGNGFVRKAAPAAQLKLGGGSPGGDAGKRKAPGGGGNPFARRSKAAKA